ncbi:RHS repeat-associated core domain-containing protein, partial [Treponema bryantii]
VEYTYDANNHRIERISKTNSVAETTQYAYGRNGALTYQKKIIGNKITSRTFSYLNNQIIGFTDLDSDGTEYVRYTVTDIQGSVTEVYDDNVSLLWKSGYTAFGIKAGENIKLLDFEGLYTGCDYDAETSLTYHWNRWRSEDGEFWLSEDPARDGINWYGYAGQNPISHSDINGLEDTLSAWQYQKDMQARAEEREKTGTGKNNTSSDIGGPSCTPETPKVINDISEGINALFNGDRGEDYRRNANNAFQNGQYVQWFLLSVDGFIEATLDIGLIPSMVITSRIDNFCQDNLGLGLAEMSMTLQSAGMLAPAGELLYHFSNWARANAAISGSSFISTTTNIGVEGLNQAAGLVGVNANSVKLNAGQQGKHIKGHNNYIPGKSVIYGNLDDAQELLTKYAGTGQKLNEHKERVNFGKIIGVYVNPETGVNLETSWGIIHTGKNGAHIVPAIPQ